MKTLTLIYVSCYLFLGGAGLAFAPGFTLNLFMLTGDYGVIVPRLIGMFMIVRRYFPCHLVF